MLEGKNVKNLPMKITISKVNSNRREDFISMRVKDENSSLVVVELEMSLKDFAEAITGLGNVHCVGEISEDINLVGKQMEMNSIEFEIPEDCGFGEERKKVARDLAFEN